MSDGSRRETCFIVGLIIGVLMATVFWLVCVRIRDMNIISAGHYTKCGKLYRVEYIAERDDFEKKIAREWETLKEIE